MYIVNACMGKWWQCSPLFILGFTLSMGSQATPQIDAVSGSFTQNGILTIRGSAFTNKAQPKPLLFWEADGGEEPSTLGRKLTWDSGFNGDVVDATDPNAEIAPGSESVAQYDISRNSGSMLGKVEFLTGETYIWRKRRDGFDINDDFAVDMNIGSLTVTSCADLVEGLWLASDDHEVFGQIVSVDKDCGALTANVHFSNKVGNIGELASKEYLTHYVSKTVEFFDPATVPANPVKADFSGASTFTAENDSGYGYRMGLNYKSIRIWADYGALDQSVIISPCFDGSPVLSTGAIILSQINPMIRCGEWDNELFQPAHEWVIEEFEYEAGSIDVDDSVMKYTMDNILALDQGLELRTAAKPEVLKDIYQFQAPHGAQLDSYEYYDSLYIDDSRHRVIICDSPTYSACENPEVQIPKAWSNSEIQILARLKAFRNVADSDKVYFQDLYLYVADGNGNINEDGMNLCIDCIKAPVFSGKASAELAL